MRDEVHDVSGGIGLPGIIIGAAVGAFTGDYNKASIEQVAASCPVWWRSWQLLVTSPVQRLLVDMQCGCLGSSIWGCRAFPRVECGNGSGNQAQ